MVERTFTFIVTEACQLKCKYCYLIGKNNAHKMSFDIAKKAADFILLEETFQKADKVIFDFIGGEPLLEIELISFIMDYLISRMTTLKHKWLYNYEIRLTTNGLLYDSMPVQQFIQMYKEHLSISISIDGTKEKNDKNRIFSNGDGSYDQVVRNVHLWIHQFPNAGTKMTISHEDVPYVFESLKHLVELGIKTIDVNPVVENVWMKEDGPKFQAQLIDFADYIIDNNIWKSLQITAFHEFLGHPLDSMEKMAPCGTMSLSIDAEGNLYSCIRFAVYSLRTKHPLCIGNINEGLNLNKVRAINTIYNDVVSPKRCLECDYASGCKWCPAESFDCSDIGTVNIRTTYNCEMHKAKVKAKNYYINKLKSIGVYYDRY